MENFWNLVQQAGPLRWPIFVVLAVGLGLVIGKLYELLRDRALARPLFEMDVRGAPLAQIRRQVAGQKESMLATLQSAMLNVFQTRPTEGMLHDEIANFVSFQQDQFGVFRRRMEFLADTAGALGLMGTVWGMFQVFFQGTSEKDVILRGMGIALITTLLGLVVSIILNLCTTELSTFFGKQLERVSRKADELRFRLLELATEGEAPLPVRDRPARDMAPPAPSIPAQPAPPSPVQAAPKPWRLAPAQEHLSTRAGETAEVAVTLTEDGAPVAGERIVFSGPSARDQRPTREQVVTDQKGRASWMWRAPEMAGRHDIDVTVESRPQTTLRIPVAVRAGPPASLEPAGNHQAAAAGMPLPKPIGVRVYDAFRNPVPAVPITFRVAEGEGRFGRGERSVVVRTDEQGTAHTTFALSSTAGPNVIHASMNGNDSAVELVAFGTEI